MASVRPRVWNNEVAKHLLEVRERAQQVPEEHRQSIAALLTQVEHLTKRPSFWGWQRLSEWWSGVRIEEIWAQLHQADLELVDVAPAPLFHELLELAVEHAEALPSEDTARLRLAEYVKDLK